MELPGGGAFKSQLKSFLAHIRKLHMMVTAKGGRIDARFFNGDDGIDIASEAAIDELLDQYEFQGLSRIGTALMNKIIRPLVLEMDSTELNALEMENSPVVPRLRTLKRPLLIMVITCGQVRGVSLVASVHIFLDFRAGSYMLASVIVSRPER